jgi:hypothetical protein
VPRPEEKKREGNLRQGGLPVLPTQSHLFGFHFHQAFSGAFPSRCFFIFHLGLVDYEKEKKSKK